MVFRKAPFYLLRSSNSNLCVRIVWGAYVDGVDILALNQLAPVAQLTQIPIVQRIPPCVLHCVRRWPERGAG